MLDDQPFPVHRKVAEEKELRKPSCDNVISPNRFDLLSCSKNESENLDHWEKYKTFNITDFKVTQPIVQEESSLNSNDGSIFKTLHISNLNKNVTEQDLIEFFGLQTIFYFCHTFRMKLILCSKTDNSCDFAYVTGPEHVCNELVKLNGINVQEKILVKDEGKKVLDTFISIIKANSSRYL